MKSEHEKVEIDQLYLKIAQLEKENEQFEIILKNTSDNIAIVTFDSKAEYLYVSPSIKLVLGYEPDELVGRSFFEFIHPEDIGKIQTKLVSYLKMKADISFEGFPPTVRETIEFRFRNKLGNWRHMDCVVNIAGDKLITVSRDISEEKLFARDIGIQKELYQSLLENVGAGIGFYDLDGRLILFNKLGAANMNGEPDDFKGKTVYEMFGDEFGKVYHERIKNTCKVNKIVEYEDEVELPTGKNWFSSRYSPIHNTIGKIIGVQIISFNITNLKNAEKYLQASEERFRTLHNASFGGITIHDKGVILDCNYGLTTITGYSMEELMGMDGLLLIAPESRDIVMANILAEYEEPYEAFGIRKNGEIYPLRLEARMIPYRDKTVRVVEFRDITERKIAEAELEEYRNNLEELVKERTAKLEEKNAELEKFNSLFVGREFRIKELRDKLKQYEKKE